MTSAAFTQQIRTRFHQADPAGVLFFAHAYSIAHDVYEGFVESLGFSYKEWFENAEWAIPLRHTEADYLKPLRPGETYDVQVFVERVGMSSFTMRYVFGQGQDVHVAVTMVHTFINKLTRAKDALPSRLREALESYQRQSLRTE